MKSKIIKVAELIQDDKNFNKGTEFGAKLINKSLEKFGAARSILIDQNNNIIAGNKTTENYIANGGVNVIVVESDGTSLIAVKRTDIDLNTAQGREMALADNATAKANIVWAEDIIADEIGIEVSESWGVIKHDIDMYSDMDMQSFFNEENKIREVQNKITLNYSEEDYNAVIEAFSKHKGSKEEIVCKLLGL